MRFPELLLFLAAFRQISVKGDITNKGDLYEQVKNLLDTFESYQLPSNNDEHFANGTSNTLINFGIYDFVIVGAGTAGGVLAHRLTENNFKILLIEAGSESPDTSAILGLAPYLYYSPWNWGYNTTTQKNACLGSIDQQCVFHRGKGLGGSSIINSGYYVRGNSRDYDNWERLGNQGWSYEDVLPYFKKSEYANFTGSIDKSYHGFTGLQSISIPEDIPGLSDAILKGFSELGIAEVDYNGKNQLGFSRTQTYTTYNIRSGSSYSFIRAAVNRDNIVTTLNSLATKLIIENGQVTGVEFVRKGQTYIAQASKEVIVSCGAINSPQLLMLSGIGPSNELKKHGIEVVKDLPVGKNMLDHVMFYALPYRTNHVYYNYSLKTSFDMWKENKRPLTAAMGVHAVSFFDLNNDELPDIEFMTGMANNLAGTLFNRVTPKFMETFEDLNYLTDFIVCIVLLHPASVGEVTLASKDPRDFPLINPNYFSDESDIETIYQGIQIALQLNNTSAFQNYFARFNLMPVPKCDDSFEKMTKDWWYCAIKHIATTIFHPIGTTRMGTGPADSVVDSNLKVHGIKGLRVVDAGVMPSHIAGHTNAPTVMIAEKAADLIKGEFRKESRISEF